MIAEVETSTQHCEKHGDYEAVWNRYSNGWQSCPKCHEEILAAREEANRLAIRNDQIADWLRCCEIPYRFRAAEFDDTTPAKLREWVNQVIRRKSPGPLVIIGPVGTGKTHASCAALKYAIRSDIRGLYITASGYGRAVRETWNRRSEYSEASLLGRYGNANFLVLDEFGANRDVDAPMLQDLVAARYDAGLMCRTIVVSNLAAAKFADVAGERVADRIREGATVIAMTGASRRKPLA